MVTDIHPAIVGLGRIARASTCPMSIYRSELHVTAGMVGI
jgi:hypothetical protein